jgi:hypothetical protein
MQQPENRRFSFRELPQICMATLVTVCFASAFAQQPAPATPVPAAQVKTDSSAADPIASQEPVVPANDRTPAQRRQDAALQERKNQLAVDTAKLLELANELKAEMDKSSKDTLSLSVIKKADEVEKLARKVRAEMKASIGN